MKVWRRKGRITGIEGDVKERKKKERWIRKRRRRHREGVREKKKRWGRKLA
jgi:hypothetical protein